MTGAVVGRPATLNGLRLGAYRAEGGNFGDDLNAWLWPRLLGARFDPQGPDVFIGIGSILDRRFDGYRRKIVFGSGARDVATVPVLDQSWTVLAVRGPLTAKALGLHRDLVATDPGLLVGRYAVRDRGADAIGFVPYFRSDPALVAAICSGLGLRVIDTRQPVESFLDQLSGCRAVFAEAMHGAIAADALRIPWAPVRWQNILLEGDTHDFKWRDWCGSLGLDFRPLRLPPVWPGDGSLKSRSSRLVKLSWARHLLRRAFRRGDFTLSPDAAFRAKTAMLEDRIEAFKRDYLA